MELIEGFVQQLPALGVVLYLAVRVIDRAMECLNANTKAINRLHCAIDRSVESQRELLEYLKQING